VAGKEAPHPSARIGRRRYQTRHVQDARLDQVSTAVAHWVVGALIGVTFALAPSLLPLSAAALVTFVVAVLALRGQARFALTGGTGTTLGLLFLYLTRRSIESCAQFNRQPGGRCEMRPDAQLPRPETPGALTPAAFGRS